VTVAWRCYQQLRSAYHAKNLTEGRAIAVKIVDTFHTCPIPEIARLGRTLRAWRTQFLAYFTTSRANNGGTEAICECRTGWSGTGWSGWSWSCRSVRDSRSN
jgi:transposase